MARNRLNAVGMSLAGLGLLGLGLLGLGGGCGSGSRVTTTTDGGAKDLAINTCVGHCAAPGACCGTPVKCIDTSADRANCGKCGAVCAAGTNCVGGTCRCPGSNSACAAGSTCCANVGCKALMNDNENCGQCGRSCADGESCTAMVGVLGKEQRREKARIDEDHRR